MNVAPLVGAWIETSQSKANEMNYKSHPSWVRGLKLVISILSPILMVVAPLVGAWIETREKSCRDWQAGVAPLVGAWIETFLSTTT